MRTGAGLWLPRACTCLFVPLLSASPVLRSCLAQQRTQAPAIQPNHLPHPPSPAVHLNVNLAGRMDVQLVSVASNADADQDWARRCLPAFRINVAASCDITLESTVDVSNVKVPDIWSTKQSAYPDAARAASQPRTPNSCPSLGQGQAYTPGAFTPAGIAATVETALKEWVYADISIPLSATFAWSGSAAGVALVSVDALANMPASAGMCCVLRQPSAPVDPPACSGP